MNLWWVYNSDIHITQKFGLWFTFLV